MLSELTCDIVARKYPENRVAFFSESTMKLFADHQMISGKTLDTQNFFLSRLCNTILVSSDTEDGRKQVVMTFDTTEVTRNKMRELYNDFTASYSCVIVKKYNMM
jgi:hypothetical protein